MASLGQLNAGIVHDIQNPLNFVNKCCDVNKEMLEELKAEHSKSAGVRDEQAKTGIINDVRANEEKLVTTQARRSYFKRNVAKQSRVPVERNRQISTP